MPLSQNTTLGIGDDSQPFSAPVGTLVVALGWKCRAEALTSALRRS